MRRARSLSILLSFWTLAACASTKVAEEEPADPTDEVAVDGSAATDGSSTPDVASGGGAAAPPASGEGALTFQGLAIETDEAPPAAEAPAPDTATCPDGRVPLDVKLLVLLRHPTDPHPALPADGFSLTVDGRPAATGVRVGRVHRLCVTPGEHEVVATGGKRTRAVRASAPGVANLPVAGGGSGPVPGLPPGRTSPVPEGTP